MEIHAKTVIETELKYIANNGIEIETEIYLILDTTLVSCFFSATTVVNPIFQDFKTSSLV